VELGTVMGTIKRGGSEGVQKTRANASQEGARVPGTIFQVAELMLASDFARENSTNCFSNLFKKMRKVLTRGKNRPERKRLEKA